MDNDLIQFSQRQAISLNWLKTFDVAARTNSFKLAAQELCVTPSAVSQQIKELERSLGIILFERHSNGLFLNEIGKNYWHEISQALEIIRTATSKIKQQNTQHNIKISLIPPVANNVIFPNITLFNQLHPEIKLILEISEKMVDIERSEFDLAIRYGIPPWKGSDYEMLLPITIQPVCTSAINDSFQLSIDPKNIITAPLIHIASTPRMWYEFIVGVMGVTQIDQKHDIYVNNYQAAMNVVLSHGVAMALTPIDNPYIDKHQLERIDVKVTWGAIYAVTAKGRLQEPAIRKFIDWLKEQLNSL